MRGKSSINVLTSKRMKVKNATAPPPTIIKVEEYGTVKYRHFKTGLLHRLDGPAYIHADGKEEWHYQGKYHREDGPAITDGDNKEYWRHGELHREDGPALISKTDQVWCQNNFKHREDGPAHIYDDGVNRHEEWYYNGRQHRENGPQTIDYKNGKITLVKYSQNSINNREDGPAVIKETQVRWYKNGLLHNDDGPAVAEMQSDGSWQFSYYDSGNALTKNDPQADALKQIIQMKETDKEIRANFKDGQDPIYLQEFNKKK